MFAQSA